MKSPKALNPDRMSRRELVSYLYQHHAKDPALPDQAAALGLPVSRISDVERLSEPDLRRLILALRAPARAASAPMPIYLCCDSTLIPGELELVSAAARELALLFPGHKVINLGTSRWGVEGRRCGDLILQDTVLDNGKINGSLGLRRLAQAGNELEPRGPMILLTGRDMTMTGLNWCFGTANHRLRASVQSVFRYRSLSQADALRCIRRTLRHELGHIFGMAHDPTRTNTEELRGVHCTNPGCSMRQVGTLTQLLRCAEAEDTLPHRFCAQCREDYLLNQRMYK